MSHTYNTHELQSKALDVCLNSWIVLTPLVYRISQLIETFGGITYAFDMEWKIRFFVVEVLNFALC